MKTLGKHKRLPLSDSLSFEEKKIFSETRREMLPGWEEGSQKGSNRRRGIGGWQWEEFNLLPRQCLLEEGSPCRENSCIEPGWMGP